MGSGALLFPAVLLLALLVVGGRWLWTRREAGRRVAGLLALPGRSPERPIAVTSFHALDDAVEEARCGCGAPLEKLGETSRPGLRVVRCTCVVCEVDQDLWFDLRELRH